ncbi:MAG: hypothetical protein UX09_C0008G0006 [Candidatus Uhrbacteria bacterium GW2011_GWE2_45_35]|uniref:Uncharacterized protein n=2 Tax=Candidatus Uhriibacteriota TaxID=1752732 RepID=A0A0G1MIP6_9BACT|nr:MAG: hypothetical protein UW63_C0006G0005 [Candidatus Uhrbacteria bacterium GW2011_GWF2_44_350]KKU08938.1 MAG: hypothetical protein UX09_C0008G0006 [Candidatus Uhrbacteria bacterium GW2011_GWE2_45_35]HBR81087.1 hypothetical protein [Candidatus Uhrbacteria bacterium]HCU32043.1 hypothetical protein [Candidatus Uhrbacteria bacterium]
MGERQSVGEPTGDRVRVDKDSHEEMIIIRDAIKGLSIQQEEALKLFQSLNREAVVVGVDEEILKHFEDQFEQIVEQIRKTAGELAKEIASLETEDKELEKDIAELTKTVDALRKVGTAVESIASSKATEAAVKTGRQEGVKSKKIEKGQKLNVLEKAVGRVERTKKKTTETREKTTEIKKKMLVLEKSGLPSSAWRGIVDDAVVDRATDETEKDLEKFYGGLTDEEKRRFDSLGLKEIPKDIEEKRKTISDLRTLSPEERDKVLQALDIEEAKVKAEILKKDQREFVRGKKAVDVVVAAVVSGELTYEVALSKIAEILDVAACDKTILIRLPEELIHILIEKKYSDNPFAEVAGSEFFETRPDLWRKRVAWLHEKKREIKAAKNQEERLGLLDNLAKKFQGRQKRDTLQEKLEVFNTGWDSVFPENIDGILRLCEERIRSAESRAKFFNELKEASEAYIEIERCRKVEEKIIKELESGGVLTDLESLKRKRQPTEQDVADLKARIEVGQAVFKRPEVEGLIEDGKAAKSKFERAQSWLQGTEFYETFKKLDKYDLEMAESILSVKVWGDRYSRIEGSRLLAERSRIQGEAPAVVKRLEVQIEVNNKYEEFKTTVMAEEVEKFRQAAKEQIVSRIEDEFKKMDFLLQRREAIKTALLTPKKRFGFIGEPQVSYRAFDGAKLSFLDQLETVSVQVAQSELSETERAFRQKKDVVGAQMGRNFPGLASSYALNAEEYFRRFTIEISNFVRDNVKYSGWDVGEIFNPVISERTNQRRTRDEYFKPGNFYDMFPQVEERLRELEKRFEKKDQES